MPPRQITKAIKPETKADSPCRMLVFGEMGPPQPPPPPACSTPDLTHIFLPNSKTTSHFQFLFLLDCTRENSLSLDTKFIVVGLKLWIAETFVDWCLGKNATAPLFQYAQLVTYDQQPTPTYLCNHVEWNFRPNKSVSLHWEGGGHLSLKTTPKMQESSKNLPVQAFLKVGGSGGTA